MDLNAYVETLGQYLTRDWLPAMQPPKLRDTTWTEYRRKVVDHVVPQLGELPLQRLTPTKLNAHYASLLYGDRHHPAWLLVATTGIRRSELAGLRWIDTDLDVGRIAVRQRLASVNRVPQFSEPQSGQSGRVIDLDRRTVEALRELRRLHDEERRLFGEVYQTAFGLVLCREDGRYVHPHYVSTLFQKAVEEAGVPRIRFHDLRSAAAQLVADAVFGAAPTATSKMTERDGDQGRDQPVRDWLQREL